MPIVHAMVAPMPEHDRNTRTYAMHSCIQVGCLHRNMTIEASPRLVLVIMMAVHVHAGNMHDMQHSMRCDLRAVSEV